MAGVVPQFTLKSTLLKEIRPKGNSFYGILNPTGTKIIFQLRVGLSKLRRHKKSHNFRDTPSDICNCGVEPEDTVHFFTKCTNFTTQRVSLNQATPLLRTLSPSPSELTQLYLYGNPSLTNIQNRQVLEASIKLLFDILI